MLFNLIGAVVLCSLITHKATLMTDTRPRKALYSAQITEEESRKFKEIAKYRGKTQAGLLRGWIDQAYKRLENAGEAKNH